MSLVFTADANYPGQIQSAGSLLALAGTITFSGSYATGGDTFPTGQDPESILKRIGLGRVVYVDISRGLGAEWDRTAKKLKFYSSGATELTAAAYAAALTASPVPVLILGR